MTTAQVARELGITTSRVRQIARARGLGVLVTDRLRLFTPAEVDAMRVRPVGRPPKEPRPAAADGDERSDG